MHQAKPLCPLLSHTAPAPRLQEETKGLAGAAEAEGVSVPIPHGLFSVFSSALA